MHGFTCGVHDLLLVPSYDKERKKLLELCLNCGEDVHQQFIGHEKDHLGMSWFFNASYLYLLQRSLFTL